MSIQLIRPKVESISLHLRQSVTRSQELTITNVMTASSMPKVTPNRGVRVTILRRKKITARTPPATPAPETTAVRSLIGAPHIVEVTFLVAAKGQNLWLEQGRSDNHTQ